MFDKNLKNYVNQVSLLFTINEYSGKYHPLIVSPEKYQDSSYFI